MTSLNKIINLGYTLTELRYTHAKAKSKPMKGYAVIKDGKEVFTIEPRRNNAERWLLHSPNGLIYCKDIRRVYWEIVLQTPLEIDFDTVLKSIMNI